MHPPLGKLIAIGGAEDKGYLPASFATQDEFSGSSTDLNFLQYGVLRRVLDEMRGMASRLEVITTASEVPDEVSFYYRQAFQRLGCFQVDFLPIRERAEVDTPDYLQRISKCDGVLFSGGDQLRLVKTFLATQLLETLAKRYQEEAFLIAGTSAGAMAMSRTMIYQGSSETAFLKGEIDTTLGLGLLPNTIIDTHFINRGRFGRLVQTVAAEPSSLGIGIGEDTGLLVTAGNRMETIGSGVVILVDGKHISYSNLSQVPNGTPLSVENLRVHVLAKGNCFFLDERRFVAEARSGGEGLELSRALSESLPGK